MSFLSSKEEAGSFLDTAASLSVSEPDMIRAWKKDCSAVSYEANGTHQCFNRYQVARGTKFVIRAPSGNF